MRNVKEITIEPQKFPYTVCMLADSHIGSGEKDWNPVVLPKVCELKPDLILHAGDVCSESALTPLREIAPVYVVRGNRDILLWFRYPHALRFNIAGVKFFLCHGQGNLPEYLYGKTMSILYDLGLIEPLKTGDVTHFPAPGLQNVILFGHTHWVDLFERNGCIYMNPGAAYYDNHASGEHPSLGILYFNDVGKVNLDIQYYNGNWHSYCKLNKEY